MPFRSDFDDVYAVIKRVCLSLGLDCCRADEVSMSGNVVGMVIAQIKKADVVIADLTGRNPNVFYETAVAHLTKNDGQVVLLSQTDDDVPFDLRPLRYLKYSNNQDGRRGLRESLSSFLKQAIKASPDQLVEPILGPEERTRRIIAECEALLVSGTATLESLVIRMNAGFSSFAIDEAEVQMFGPKERPYRRMLLRERDLFTELVAKGAAVKAILSPPMDRPLRGEPDYLSFRFRRLMKILDDRAELDRYAFVLSPFRGNNLIIFNDRVCYDGVKTTLRSGYNLTTRVTHTALVSAQVTAFDAMFEDSRMYTLECFGRAPKRGREKLIKAVQEGLEHAYRKFSKRGSPNIRT